MGLIKEKLQQQIGKNNLQLVLSIIEIVAPGDTLYLIKNRLARLEQEEAVGVSIPDDKKLEINRIIQAVFSILPESDFSVLKGYLSKLQSSNEKGRASELLRKCSRYLQWTSVEDEYEEEIEQIIPHLEDEVERVSETDMLPNWEETLWDDIFNFAFTDSNVSSTPTPQTGDVYLDSILKLDEKDKKVNFNRLFLWAEQYAAGDYEDAYLTAQDLRLQNARGKYPSYEYLFLSYAHECQKKGRQEEDPWFLPDNKKYKKLWVYLNNANSLHHDSSTLPYSKSIVGNLLLGELETLFDQTNHDYVVRNTTRLSNKKREIMAQVFEAYRQIKDDFEIKGNHRIFEKLLVELLGGAKFRWMHLGEGGVVNLSAFDAKSTFENWKNLLDESDPSAASRVSDVLKGNFRYKIGSLSIVKNKRVKQRELRNACCLADHFFPESGFLELAKNIAKEGRGAIQEDVQPLGTEESHLFSEKSALDFTDKKIRELLLDDQKEADGASQPTENQIQVSISENLNDDKIEEMGLEVEDMREVSEQQRQGDFQEEPQVKSEQPLVQDSAILENWESPNSFVKGLPQPKKLFPFQVDFCIKIAIFIMGFAPLYFLRGDIIGVLLCFIFLSLMGIIFLKK